MTTSGRREGGDGKEGRRRRSGKGEREGRRGRGEREGGDD